LLSEWLIFYSAHPAKHPVMNNNPLPKEPGSHLIPYHVNDVVGNNVATAAVKTSTSARQGYSPLTEPDNPGRERLVPRSKDIPNAQVYLRETTPLECLDEDQKAHLLGFSGEQIWVLNEATYSLYQNVCKENNKARRADSHQKQVEGVSNYHSTDTR
jgi:hypothetical protein